jgi:hypothetical protein
MAYTLRHETSGDRSAAGTAAPTGDPAAHRGHEPVGSGARSECVGEFSVPLGSDVPAKGSTWTGPPANAGAPTETVAGATRAVGAGPAERPTGGRLSDGALDARARRGSHPALVWGAVPSVSRLAPAPPDGLELPETGAARHRTRRSGDRGVEAAALAAYKKTPHDVAPISSSLMNQGFCSFPMWPAHGPRAGARRACTISTNTTGCRRSRRSRCPHNGGIWDSICSFRHGRLTAWMSAPSSPPCSATSAAPSCSSGIGARSIAAEKLRHSSGSGRECRWSTSQGTRPNSIPQSLCGRAATAPWPTVLPAIRGSSVRC